MPVARLFRNGRSQAVRLPKEFRFSGDRVRIRRFGRGVLLEPIDVDADAWFARIDTHGEGSFLVDGHGEDLSRDQPSILNMPDRDLFE